MFSIVLAIWVSVASIVHNSISTHPLCIQRFSCPAKKAVSHHGQYTCNLKSSKAVANTGLLQSHITLFACALWPDLTADFLIYFGLRL